MRLVAAMVCWLIALAVSSVFVAATAFTTELVMQPNWITASELSRGTALTAFVMSATPLVFLFAFVPALIVTAFWKARKISVYAVAGMITGVAFPWATHLFYLPLGPSTIVGPLRYVLLGGISGFLGGYVMAWQVLIYSRLFLRRQPAQ